MAEQKIELVNVEVKSEITGRTIMSFQAEKETARDTAWTRLSNFLHVNRAVASLNHFIEIT